MPCGISTAQGHSMWFGLSYNIGAERSSSASVQSLTQREEGADLSHSKEGRTPWNVAGVFFKGEVLAIFQNALAFCYLSPPGWCQPQQGILQLQREKVKPREGWDLPEGTQWVTDP